MSLRCGRPTRLPRRRAGAMVLQAAVQEVQAELEGNGDAVTQTGWPCLPASPQPKQRIERRRTGEEERKRKKGVERLTAQVQARRCGRPRSTTSQRSVQRRGPARAGPALTAAPPFLRQIEKRKTGKLISVASNRSGPMPMPVVGSAAGSFARDCSVFNTGTELEGAC
mgnify:CR=1 FL=1